LGADLRGASLTEGTFIFSAFAHCSELYSSQISADIIAARSVFLRGLPSVMIGDLNETPRGGILDEAPTECVNGQHLRAGPGYSSGTSHAPGQGSHMGWTCLVCDATFYWPPTDPTCSVLVGAARVR